MKTLNEIQDHLKSILPTGIDLAIEAAKAQLVEGTDKYNDLLLLEGRYREVGRQLLQGILSNEDAQIEFNKIRHGLLEFIDTLQDTHLVNTPDDLADDRPDIYNGEVFYRIPKEMQLEEEVRCLVRLAFDRKVIMEDLELQSDDVLKDLRISEVMGVELLDAHGQCFAIRTLNDTVQFVDKDLYTEWVFFVKPTATGEHPLTLKISIIEIRDGVERKRNVVLEEKVIVVTTPVEEKEGVEKKAAHALQLGVAQAAPSKDAPPAPPPAAPKPGAPAPRPAPAAPKSGGRSFRKMAPALAGVFAIVLASWAAIQGGLFSGGGGTSPIVDEPVSIVKGPDTEMVLPPVMTIEEFWKWTEGEDTRDAYEEFVASIEEGEYHDLAMRRLDSIETAIYETAINDGTVAAVEIYLEDYPEGKYAGEARQKVRDLESSPRRQDEPVPAQPGREEIAGSEVEEPGQPTNDPTGDKPAKTAEAEKPQKTEDPNKPVSMQRASRKPIYPGCKNDRKREREVKCTENQIRRFLSNRLKYPDEAKRREIEGTVHVVFVVEKDGRVTDVHAVRGPGGGCEEEAIRLVNSLPKFEPGQNRAGQPIRVKYHLPITFRLR